MATTYQWQNRIKIKLTHNGKFFFVDADGVQIGYVTRAPEPQTHFHRRLMRRRLWNAVATAEGEPPMHLEHAGRNVFESQDAALRAVLAYHGIHESGYPMASTPTERAAVRKSLATSPKSDDAPKPSAGATGDASNGALSNNANKTGADKNGVANEVDDRVAAQARIWQLIREMAGDDPIAEMQSSASCWGCDCKARTPSSRAISLTRC